MKLKKQIGWLAFELACIPFIVSMMCGGCASPGGNSALLTLAQAGVIEGASLGTAQLIKNNPSSRPDFVLAANVLTTLSTGTNTITSASIQAVLAQAGETNASITTLITSGLAVADQYLTQVSSANPNSIYLDAVGWLATGIKDGLNSSLPALKAKYHAR